MGNIYVGYLYDGLSGVEQVRLLLGNSKENCANFIAGAGDCAVKVYDSKVLVYNTLDEDTDKVAMEDNELLALVEKAKQGVSAPLKFEIPVEEDFAEEELKSFLNETLGCTYTW